MTHDFLNLIIRDRDHSFAITNVLLIAYDIDTTNYPILLSSTCMPWFSLLNSSSLAALANVLFY